jgi:hypothetical protein
MATYFHTKIKASTGFWKDPLIEQIKYRTACEITKVGTDEIYIISRGDKPFLKLNSISKKYPDEIFRIKIRAEDYYENLVFLYECTKGKSILIKKGFEYCFAINKSDREKLPDGLYTRFQRVVADYYQKLESYPHDYVSLDIGKDEAQNPKDIDGAQILLDIIYSTREVSLTARKHGKTFIEVSATFLNRKKDPEIPKEENQTKSNGPTEYDELPF